MTPETLIICSIIFLIIAIFSRKNLEKFGAKAGHKYGTKIRKKYESQPRLSDNEIIQIISNHSKHSSFYILHVVREAEDRKSQEVKNKLKDFHQKTKNKFKTTQTENGP